MRQVILVLAQPVQEGFVLFVRCVPELSVCSVQDLNYFREELCFFVVVVRLDEFVPCERVAYKCGFVFFFDVGGLEVDGVVAAEDGVVDVGHVRGSGCEDVVLICQILWRFNELAWLVCPDSGSRG